MPGTHVISPAGEIDLSVADTLLDTWLRVIRREQPSVVVVDLACVTFLDSAALSALIRLRRCVLAQGGHLLLRGASPRQQLLLRVTALDDVFPDAELPHDTGSPDHADPSDADRPDRVVDLTRARRLRRP
jgi:anti-sigma B factor antagonist